MDTGRPARPRADLRRVGVGPARAAPRRAAPCGSPDRRALGGPTDGRRVAFFLTAPAAPLVTVYHSTPSPLGPLLLTSDGTALTGVFMGDHRHGPAVAPDWTRDAAPFADARAQLAEYFAGTRRAFDLDVRPAGTPFQQRVWTALLAIPYGATETYGALAERMGDANLSRAVGAANGRNPLSVVVPCHRVVGAAGALVGYGGGLENKRRLLALESRQATLFS